ncbi:MAG: hypothetical protein OK455_06010 [Thaumarchaeota archaeon]|nr:hypothetical protein [Nitrososphaerota archaeon]
MSIGTGLGSWDVVLELELLELLELQEYDVVCVELPALELLVEVE